MPATLETAPVLSQRPPVGTSASSRGGTGMPPGWDGKAATLAHMSRQRAIDLGIALVAFALTLVLLLSGGVGPHDAGLREVDALAIGLAALSTLPLAFWRLSPLGVYVVIVVANGVLNSLDYPDGPPFGAAIALFLLASVRTELRVSGRTLAVVIVGLFVAHFIAHGLANDAFPGTELLLGSALWTAAWFAGDRARLRRERIAELEERARRAEREAERERQLAAAEERTRIARDLHDSAGHAINVILVHAGAARLLAEKDPGRSREALGTIETVARETLREIDALVRALRDDDRTVQPPAGLAALDRLVERHREAGLDVEVRTRGERRPLGPAADQAAYRILQESLTNALRHGAGSAEVRLDYGADAVELGVTNPASGNGAVSAGHGIVGMRERATLLGGSVDVAAADGRFAVRARLPYCEEDT
jgi:signal transduction histidine kinase